MLLLTFLNCVNIAINYKNLENHPMREVLFSAFNVLDKLKGARACSYVITCPFA